MKHLIDTIKNNYKLSSRCGLREVLFVYLIHAGIKVPGLPESRGGIIALHQMRSIEKETIEAIKNEIKCHFVDKLDLSWIKKNERQLKWLSIRIDDSFPSNNLPTIDDIHERDRIIAQIDICNIDIREKQIRLDKLRQEWKEELRNDTIFDSIKGEGERKKCEYISSWIKKNIPEEKFEGNLKNHHEVIIFFTQKKIRFSIRKKCITATRNWFNQKKSRDSNPDTIQFNVKISRTTKKHIEKICIEKKIDQASLIEELIQNEWIKICKNPIIE